MQNKKVIISEKNCRRTISAKAGTGKRSRVAAGFHNDWIHATVMDMLSSRGYRVIRPQESRLFARAPFVSYIGVNDNYETLCVKVKKPDVPGKLMSVLNLCGREIPLLRSLLMESWGDTYIRCEIWIFSGSKEMACIEVTPDGLCLLPQASIRPLAMLRPGEAGEGPAGCTAVTGESCR